MYAKKYNNLGSFCCQIFSLKIVFFLSTAAKCLHALGQRRLTPWGHIFELFGNFNISILLVFFIFVPYWLITNLQSFPLQRFPSFRIAYFIFWTSIFVIFQWIIHACVSMW